MTATMSGGQTYSGQYFQITKNTTVDGIGQCQLHDGTTIDANFPIA
jgi:hypothetical protein